MQLRGWECATAWNPERVYARMMYCTFCTRMIHVCIYVCTDGTAMRMTIVSSMYCTCERSNDPLKDEWMIVDLQIVLGDLGIPSLAVIICRGRRIVPRDMGMWVEQYHWNLASCCTPAKLLSLQYGDGQDFRLDESM
jgi:hypothetical protein